MHCGDPWTGQLNGGTGMAPVLFDGLGNNEEMAEGEKPTESGGRSTEEPDEPSTASPRLRPVPDSPPHSAQPSPELVLGDTGHTSESFDRKCAPPQAPRCESTNCMSCANNVDIIRRMARRRSRHVWRPWMLWGGSHREGPRMIWIRRRLFWEKGLALWRSPCLLKPRQWGRMGSVREGMLVSPLLRWTFVVQEHAQ